MSEKDGMDQLINSLLGDEKGEDILTFTDADGNNVDFVVVDGIEIDGVNYILAEEKVDSDDEEAETILLKETNTEGDDAVLEIVEDENEFQKVIVLLQENEPDYEMDFGNEKE